MHGATARKSAASRFSAGGATMREDMNVAQPEPLLLAENQAGILRLTLNRPKARNALSSALMRALIDALEAAAGDKSVRVIVLAANGPVFSAGHDLREMTEARAAGDQGKTAFAALFT